MQYVFYGSGLFGATVLEHLDPKPVFVITQPDRLGGRGMKTLIPTPVKLTAEKLSIRQGHSLSTQGVTLSGFPLVLVADYGKIIKQEDLKLPKNGFWNIHPSLLPKYRGPTPLQTTLLHGEKITGVSIIKLDELVDHGPILAQEKIAVEVNNDYLSLLEKTAKLGASMFNKLYNDLLAPPTSISASLGAQQTHDLATFTKKVKKENGFIEIEKLVPYLEPIFKKYNLTHLLSNKVETAMDSLRLHNMVRAYYPWPCVWTKSGEKVIKITKSAWGGEIEIQEVVIEGKKYSI